MSWLVPGTCIVWSADKPERHDDKADKTTAYLHVCAGQMRRSHQNSITWVMRVLIENKEKKKGHFWIFYKATPVIKYHQGFKFKVSAPSSGLPRRELKPQLLPSVSWCVHNCQIGLHLFWNWRLVYNLKSFSTATVVLLVATGLQFWWGGVLVQMEVSHIFMIMLH